MIFFYETSLLLIDICMIEVDDRVKIAPYSASFYLDGKKFKAASVNAGSSLKNFECFSCPEVLERNFENVFLNLLIATEQCVK